MSDALTFRQQAILDFIRAQVDGQGLPPTLAEIARAFGFNQTRAAHKHLLALEAKGCLQLIPGKARGIRRCCSTARCSSRGRITCCACVATRWWTTASTTAT